MSVFWKAKQKEIYNIMLANLGKNKNRGAEKEFGKGEKIKKK